MLFSSFIPAGCPADYGPVGRYRRQRSEDQTGERVPVMMIQFSVLHFRPICDIGVKNRLLLSGRENRACDLPQFSTTSV